MNAAKIDWPPASSLLPFEQLVRDYQDALRGFAFRLTGNSDSAADLTQQTFYLAFKHQHRLRDPRRVRSWLHSILHREFLQRLRRHRRSPELPWNEEDESHLQQSVQHVERIDAQQAMSVLMQLDEKFRLPLALFYLEELSYRDIAERMAIPIGTVMSRLSRGKRMLRSMLQETAAGSDADPASPTSEC
ncbi:MAG TPA: RNA polymerase subunit sigma-24 [Verrucomicrobiales bacterium]|nr:RNA polymerase subunit sigma-24 [Verrucomicrobiales bacterium]